MANVETKRANRAYETETHRANLARERETFRSNTTNESIGWFRAAEDKRSNIANEIRNAYHEQWSRQIAFLDYDRKVTKDKADIAQGWENVEVRKGEMYVKMIDSAFKNLIPLAGAVAAIPAI